VQRPDRVSYGSFVLIAVATALAYARSVHGTWISDDIDMIAGNPMLQSLSLANLRAIATFFEGNINYIPIPYLSFALDYQIWGAHPYGFHVTNVVLHVVNAWLVYLVILRIHGSRGLALAAGLFWALHPVQVESVAWISERKNLLSTLFFLLAFHTYLRYSARPSAGTYLLAFVLFVAALLSKVNTIVLPAIMLAYEIVFQRRLRTRDVLATLPLLASGALVAWINLHGNTSHGAAYHGGSFAVTMRTSSTTIPRYLENILVPFDLSAYYAVPLRGSWLDPPVAVGAAVVVGLVCATLVLAWRTRPEAFWLAWFGITLSPMLNLVPFPALMNDRYLYMPLLGVLMVVLLAGRALFGRMTPVVVGAVATGLALLTVARVPVFWNPFNLWADSALRTPYITADQPYGAAPRLEEKRFLTEALARDPNRAVIHNNLGGFAYEENRLGEAIPYLTRAYELDPTDGTIALNLGRALLRAGRLDEALPVLEAAARLESPVVWVHLNLGQAYLRKGDVARARDELEIAKTIKKDPYFWTRLEQQIVQAERRGP
jgi:hypothetical protein